MQRFLPALRPRTWLILAGLLVLVALLLPLDVIYATAPLMDGEAPIRRFLFGVILNLTGWFLWLGGAILDYGVNAFVINFGTNFNQNGVGEAVNELWVIVRDFFNIFFIFGLVYIGFKMILNSDDSQTKQTLVYLIMAALLINFSLFITKFVVDFTNVLAGEIAVAGFDAANEEGTEIDGNARNNVAIGDTFFRLMGIQQTVLLTPTGVESNQTSPWSYIFGVGIINIIGAFAFGVGGIMLIIRFVALTVYMVLSPFMFLGWIFPGFQSMSRKYWSGFLKQAFYAPVYIVMIFFAATILNNFFRVGGSFENANLGSLAGTEGLLGADGGQQVVFGAGLAPFILSAAFLIAAVQVAGKLSADGSTVMAKVGGAVQSRVRRTVGGAALGLPARGLRATVGAGANAYTNSERGRKFAANSMVGRQVFKASQKAANSSFDARRVGGVGKTMGIGEGSKASYAKTIKDRAKSEGEFAKAIAGDFDEKAPESVVLIAKKAEEVKKQKQTEIDNKRQTYLNTRIKREEKIEKIQTTIADGGGTATEAQKNELEMLQNQIADEEKVIELQIINLQKDMEDRNAKDIATGKLKFANELAYVEQLKKSERFFKGVFTNFGAMGSAAGATSYGAGALGIAGATGLVGGGAAIAASIGMINSGNAAKAGYKAILKQTGEDGRKGIKAADQKKKLSALESALKESKDSSADTDTKSEDKDEKE